MTRFEVMSEDEARRTVDHTRRAIAAQMLGGIRSSDPVIRSEAQLMSLQSETYENRLAAQRRLRSVSNDMSADEYRAYFREKRGRLALAMANAANARRGVSRREDTRR